MFRYYGIDNSLPANLGSCSFHAKHVEGTWFLFWVNEKEWSSSSSVCWLSARLISNNFPHSIFFMIRCDPELQCRTELCRADQLKATWEHRIQKQFGKKKKEELKIYFFLFCFYLNRGEFCCYYRLFEYHELNNPCFKINYSHHSSHKTKTTDLQIQ